MGELIVKMLVYLPLSSLEVIAIFALMFSLYRIPFKSFGVQTVSVSVIMTLIVYILDPSGRFNMIGSLLSLALIAVYLRLIIKAPTIYSIIMTGVGYVAYALIQTTVRYLLDVTNLIPETSNPEMIWERAITQILCIFISFLIAGMMHRFRKGFNFVPVDSSVPVTYKPLSVVLMAVAVASSILVVSTIYYIGVEGNGSLFTACVLFSIAFYALIYLSIRNEYEDSD